MGAHCEVRFEWVGEIPELSSGKFRYTISNVDRSLLRPVRDHRRCGPKARISEYHLTHATMRNSTLIAISAP